MLESHGIQAWVEVDGVKLKTYDVQTSSDGKVITCWIASEEGKVCNKSIYIRKCNSTLTVHL